MMTTFGLIVRFNDSDIIAQSSTDRTIDDYLIFLLTPRFPQYLKASKVKI